MLLRNPHLSSPLHLRLTSKRTPLSLKDRYKDL